MRNQELIESKDREEFFTQICLRCQDIAEALPDVIGRLRLVVQTDRGHVLVSVPMEQGDVQFLEIVVAAMANLAAKKSSAAALAKQELDGLI